MNIPIVYEDDWLLVVNKPSGLLVVSTPKNESRTLTNLLNENLKQKGFAFRLHPCHRLDKDTSGLIIYAKGKSIQKKIMDLFKKKQIEKTYIAFVQGTLVKNQAEIRRPIEGLTAITKYKVVERKSGFTIVKVFPLTGRTNQIRIHFKELGHPVLGEKKFAFRKDFKLKANRLCLHAKTLRFIHPITHKPLVLDSDLPLGMRNFLEKYPE